MTALPLLVFKLSGSALDLGFIGAWVDRVNRKGPMIGLDIARAAVLAVLPGLSLFGHLPIWWIYLAP